jgi:hypothetical protein
MADLSEKEIVEIKENEEIKNVTIFSMTSDNIEDGIEDDIDQAKENGFYWRELEDFGPEDFGLGDHNDKDEKEKEDKKEKEEKEDDEYFNDFQDVEMYDYIALQVFA